MGAGPARERVALATRQDSRDPSLEARALHPGSRVCVLPFRDPGEQDVRQGAYRDVFTAFPEGQNTDTLAWWHPGPRVIAGAEPFYRMGFCGSLPCKRKAGKAGRRDSRDAVCAAVSNLSGILPGASLPFAGRARSHKPSFVERSGRCSDPWRFRCQVSGAMVVPGGSCLAREGQTNSGQG